MKPKIEKDYAKEFVDFAKGEEGRHDKPIKIDDGVGMVNGYIAHMVKNYPMDPSQISEKDSKIFQEIYTGFRSRGETHMAIDANLLLKSLKHFTTKNGSNCITLTIIGEDKEKVIEIAGFLPDEKSEAYALIMGMYKDDEHWKPPALEIEQKLIPVQALEPRMAKQSENVE